MPKIDANGTHVITLDVTMVNNVDNRLKGVNIPTFELTVTNGTDTGVDNVEITRGSGESYYNLNGHRTGKPDKGVFIVRTAEGRLQGKNGKKMILQVKQTVK